MADKVKSGKYPHPSGIKTSGQMDDFKGPVYEEGDFTPYNKGMKGDKKGPKTTG